MGQETAGTEGHEMDLPIENIAAVVGDREGVTFRCVHQRNTC